MGKFESSTFKDCLNYFHDLLTTEPDTSIAIAGVKTLTHLIQESKATTMMGLEIDLKEFSEILTSSRPSSFALSSGLSLYLRFVTRTLADIAATSEGFAAGKSHLISRGEDFVKRSRQSRTKIAHLANKFIREGQTVLVHGHSRVVMAALLHAARQFKHFSVIATESRPSSGEGVATAKELAHAGIPVTFICDSAVAYMMEKVDVVLTGAEALVENGGIINKIGTYQVALVAKAHNKPVYVAAESFKFARFYPLNQRDLSARNEQMNMEKCQDVQYIPNKNMQCEFPQFDYTPPENLTLLLTDLAVLTPAAVSDELIKLYG
eukprot:GCRY01002428.1.p1 GENE.GCRY01002428.1~~GCRY01002428.1.p1  ORF type:complete len:321 (+),score=88.42 GCRY01002428.1:173-1135(+)